MQDCQAYQEASRVQEALHASGELNGNPMGAFLAMDGVVLDPGTEGSRCYQQTCRLLAKVVACVKRTCPYLISGSVEEVLLEELLAVQRAAGKVELEQDLLMLREAVKVRNEGLVVCEVGGGCIEG
jgi:hypothetical protein